MDCNLIFSKTLRKLLLITLIAPLLTACGIKGSLTPPSQIQKEERSEPTRRQGRDPVEPI
jgi:predicted small lipoprotein YifL